MASPNDGSEDPPGPDGGFRGAARRPTGPDGATSILDRSLAFTREYAELAWVPLVTALLAVDDLVAVGSQGGLGVHLSFPLSRADLWTFVQRPTTAGVDVAAPFVGETSVVLGLALLAAYLVVSGALTAGYFGSIAEALETGSFDFVANVRRYARRMIVLETLVLVAFAALLAPIAAVPPLFVVAVVLGFVAAYFLFPTAYLVVLEDRSVLGAIERAVELVQTHQPIGFVLHVALAVGACSIVLSTLARSSVPGAVTAAVLAAPLGLALNAAVTLKVRSWLGDERSRASGASHGIDGRARR